MLTPPKLTAPRIVRTKPLKKAFALLFGTIIISFSAIMMSGFAPLRISPEKTGKFRERFLRRMSSSRSATMSHGFHPHGLIAFLDIVDLDFKKVILAVQAGIFQGGLLRNIIHHEGLVHPAGLPRERR